jgi:light-regulated signal transduction histidine kinase (bacteriophytochrome)
MNEAIDLTNCEHEPITIPGCIQPHGLLLVLRAADLAVVQVSANTAHFLDIAPGETLGQPDPARTRLLCALVSAGGDPYGHLGGRPQ